MRFLKHTFLAKLSLVLCVMGLSAQSSIVTSGGEIDGVEGSISYSIGQVVYTTVNGVDASISQGVQQSYKISNTTAVKSIEDINLMYNVYPNPSQEVLTLILPESSNGSFSFKLYNVQGQVVKQQENILSTSLIDVRALSSSTYILHVLKSHEVVETFKIIKD